MHECTLQRWYFRNLKDGARNHRYGNVPRIFRQLSATHAATAHWLRGKHLASILVKIAEGKTHVLAQEDALGTRQALFMHVPHIIRDMSFFQRAFSSKEIERKCIFG